MFERKCGPTVAKWSRHRIAAGFVTSSSPVPLRTRCVRERCTLNLSKAETFSCRSGVVVRKRRCQVTCRPRYLAMVQIKGSIAQSPCVAK
ncbi:hypothetical protein TNCV_2710251 [Trichonephila clavipes]|nr:hypothetical protein TNCV_2710251 [Trichonephila clavipes]